ncbi:DUF349 domain-containing protein [Chryseobacterium gambrini]|uniref:DUF349 domain-containing protein n=1 Tax=Chryseobacterium gambrini TaxID=373672 RepID=A0AAJ1R5J3_9FLAO|nr:MULTISPECIES: DUF349 domain-containing protein [Chryseobacterium]MDN4013465.1 DUF349 domain-containing protein [Chryseobacterium gambrini]MDN4028722.1 DUF349 domain-containing protein [Chryseobacterium gambrini]QWA37778.1 DUF349 domain-containing protein [Chryseobacterium sp. ZHDP1]
MTTENNLSENEENKNSNEVLQEKPLENTEVQDENVHHEDTEHEEEHEDVDISLADALKEMERIINAPNAGEDFKKFNQLKEKASHYIHDEVEDKKHEYTEAGNAPENFSYEHPSQAKFSALVNIFREKHDAYQKGQEEEQKKNLEHRQSIIERLKNLYTNSEPGTNLFKSIREIKEEWSKAGQVAKSEFRILNNNYFHHLNQFYQMLDLNKEFLEQEYSHNLEKRQHIIERAKQLEHEPVIQKALNELQYLHKLWKEEAEPVAEEFREKTWEEFKEISNKIHERKSELSAAIETEQNENLEKKNQIIAEIKKLSEPGENPNHNYWQNAIRRVEELRSEFLKTGSVPRKLSNQNWNEFKTILRGFNTTKNTYYKSLKGSQQANLEEKLKLIQTAKDNQNNEEWDIAVPLFKKLQEDWKKIGHVPKSMTNKIWDEFRDACNAFFNNYREKSNASTDNWKENYKQKKAILDELKTIGNEEGSIERIEAIKTAWNNIGKVPRDKISINTEFNKTLREKLKLNKINELELKEEGLSENQLTDKARKIKSQISDLEAEIVKLENNLAFFKNPSRENPMLRDTYDSIDEKKAHLETLKQNLHSIIAGE